MSKVNLWKDRLWRPESLRSWGKKIYLKVVHVLYLLKCCKKESVCMISSISCFKKYIKPTPYIGDTNVG